MPAEYGTVVVADVAGECSHLGELAVSKTAQYITFVRDSKIQPLLTEVLFAGECQQTVYIESLQSHVFIIPNFFACLKCNFQEREKQQTMGMFANYGIPSQLHKDVEPQPVSGPPPFVFNST